MCTAFIHLCGMHIANKNISHSQVKGSIEAIHTFSFLLISLKQDVLKLFFCPNRKKEGSWPLEVFIKSMRA